MNALKLVVVVDAKIILLNVRHRFENITRNNGILCPPHILCYWCLGCLIRTSHCIGNINWKRSFLPKFWTFIQAIGYIWRVRSIAPCRWLQPPILIFLKSTRVKSWLINYTPVAQKGRLLPGVDTKSTALSISEERFVLYRSKKVESFFKLRGWWDVSTRFC